MADGELQPLGQMLRQAREARGLDLDEVEMQTRIRAKYIQALETGDLSVLPSVTHAKGFLRNYAAFLQLDMNLVMAQFAAMTGGGTMPVTSVTANPSYTPPLRPAGSDQRGPDGRIMLPNETPPQTYPVQRPTYVTPKDRVGPAVPRGMGPGAKPHPSQPIYTPPQPEEAPARESQLKGLPARIIRSWIFTAAILLVGFVIIVWWSTTQLSKIEIDEIIPTPDDSEVIEAENIPTTAPEITFQPTSTEAQVVNLTPQILDRVLLNIEVTRRTWVRITVDGEIEFEGQADPGSVLQYEGQTEIIVLAGNAGGLDINYNGLDLGLMGERGELKQVFFTSVGKMLTPTATPTVTPTPTGVPSPTPRS